MDFFKGIFRKKEGVEAYTTMCRISDEVKFKDNPSDRQSVEENALSMFEIIHRKELKVLYGTPIYPSGDENHDRPYMAYTPPPGSDDEEESPKVIKSKKKKKKKKEGKISQKNTKSGRHQVTHPSMPIVVLETAVAEKSTQKDIPYYIPSRNGTRGTHELSCEPGCPYHGLALSQVLLHRGMFHLMECDENLQP